MRWLALVLVACKPGDADTAKDTGSADGDADTDTDADTDADADADTDTDDGIHYADDVRPIFLELCIDCHHPGTAAVFDLTDPFDPATGIVGRANTWNPNGSPETLIVDPGNPDNSFLLRKMEATELDDHVDGATMPLLLPLVEGAELDAVEQWILDGAPDDARFRSDVASIFGTEITLGRASGRCTFCHYPGSPTGMSVLDVFDPVEGMVDRDSLFGGKIVAPGDPGNSVLMTKLQGATIGQQMPLHHRRVTAEEVAVVREWIELGALDD